MNNNTNEIKTVYMKEWFYSKNSYNAIGPYCDHSCTVCKETEKAYQVVVVCKNNSWVCWVPKSCTVATFEEKLAEDINADVKRAEYEASREARWEEACRKYAELIAYAQKLGVRGVREGLRRETIERKILNAGFSLPA